MQKSKIFIIILCLLTILTVSASFASEDTENIQTNTTDLLSAGNNADIQKYTSDMESQIEKEIGAGAEKNSLGSQEIKSANDKNNLISLSNDENVLEDEPGTFTELKAKIDETESGSTLYLNKSYVSSGYQSSGIEINKPITIDGQGHILDGQNNSRIFYIKTSNVVLKNITFQNAVASGIGGAIYASVSSSSLVKNINFTNCNFINNRNKDSSHSHNGGSVYVYGTDIVFENCNFSNEDRDWINFVYTDYKNAANGGEIYISGGAEYSGGNNIINNCHFYQSYATYNGGAVYLSGSNNVINNSDFNYSSATYIGTSSLGGAVYFGGSNNKVLNSNFSNFFSVGKGEAIYFARGNNLVNNSRFIIEYTSRPVPQYSVDKYSRYNATAALYFAEANNTVDNSYFEGGYCGQIFFVKNDNVVNNSQFVNSHDVSVIKAPNSNSRVVIANSNFTNNDAVMGSAVYGQNIEIINSNFINNTAKFGGAVYVNSSSIKNCIFNDNTAEYLGGAVLLDRGTTTINNSQFNNNDASAGGALFIHNSANQISYSNFTGNRVSSDGSAIYIGSGSNQIEHVIFKDNTLFESIPSSKIVVTKTVLNDTYTSVNFYCAEPLIRNVNVYSLYEDNQLYYERYALSNDETYSYRNKYGDLHNHYTVESDDIRAFNWTYTYRMDLSKRIDVRIDTYGGEEFISWFDENIDALSRGGAVFIIGGTGIKITNSTFINNEANQGGAIYQASAVSEIIKSNFSDSADYGSEIFLGSDLYRYIIAFRNNKPEWEWSRVSSVANTLSLKDSNLNLSKAHTNIELYLNSDLNLDGKFYLNDNYLNGVYVEESTFIYENVSYDKNGIFIPMSGSGGSDLENQNITVEFYDENGVLLDNKTYQTDAEGNFEVEIFDLLFNQGTLLYVKAYHLEDEQYYYCDTIFVPSFGDFQKLQYLIDHTENGVLSLNSDYTYTIGKDTITDGIVIDKDIIINGNGHTINALNQSSIFSVYGMNTVFNNITFTNALNRVIYYYYVSNAIIDNSSFINNAVSESAVYFTGDNLTINNSEFINISASTENLMENNGIYYAVPYYEGVGPIVAESNANIVISKSKFENIIFTDIGFYLWGENIEINDVEFINNRRYAVEYDFNDEGEPYISRIFEQSEEEVLIGIEYASTVNISNVNFENESVSKIFYVTTDNFNIKNTNISNSKLSAFIDGTAYYNLDIDGLIIDNVSSIFYEYEWNSQINDYIISISGWANSIIFLESGMEYDYSIGEDVYFGEFSVKNVEIRNISASYERVFEFYTNNLAIDNINISNYKSESTYMFYYEELQDYIIEKQLSGIYLYYIGVSDTLNFTNVNVNNLALSYGDLNNFRAKNLLIENVSFSNILSQWAQTVFYIESYYEGTFEINNVSLKNMDAKYEEIYEYEGIVENTTDIGPTFRIFDIYASNTNTNISNINISNVLMSGFVEAESRNFDMTNISIKDSGLIENDGFIRLYTYGYASFENMDVDHVMIVPSSSISITNGVVTENRIYLSQGTLSIDVTTYGGAYLSDINITNSQSISSYKLLTVYAEDGNIIVKDINIENVTGKEKLDIESSNGLTTIYENTSGDFDNGFYFYAYNGNINITNFNVNHLESYGNRFLYVEGVNLVLDNVSIADATSFGYWESIRIYAYNDLMVNNFALDNYSPGNGYNRTYDYNFKRVYDYYSLGNPEENFNGELGIIMQGMNAKVDGLNLTNIVLGDDGYLFVISADYNLDVDNVFIENITGTDKVSILYNTTLTREIINNSTSIINGFAFQAINLNVSNIIVNNYEALGPELFFGAYGFNITVENVSISNSQLPGMMAPSILIMGLGENSIATVNNFSLTNTTTAKGKYYTYFDSKTIQDYHYNYTSFAQPDPVSYIMIYSDNLDISGLSLNNMEAAYNGFLLDVKSKNLTVNNIFIEDVKGTDNVIVEYNKTLMKNIYDNYTSLLSGLIFNSTNAELYNIIINNLQATGKLEFFMVEGQDNVIIENVSVTNSQLSYTSAATVEINAQNDNKNGNLTINNFSITDSTSAMGQNHTYYDYDINENYHWEFNKFYEPSGPEMKINSNNAYISDFVLKNLASGGAMGLLKIDNTQNLTIDKLLIKDITPVNFYDVIYNLDFDKYFYETNYGSSSGGLLIDNGLSLNLSNIEINNITFTHSGLALSIQAQNSTLENISVANATYCDLYYTHFSEEYNKYVKEREDSIQSSCIYISVLETSYIDGFVVDTVTGLDKTIDISVPKLIVNNSLFKNIETGWYEYTTDYQMNEIIESFYSSGVGMYIDTDDIYILNTGFEDMKVGSSALSISAFNSVVIENSTFKNINSSDWGYVLDNMFPITYEYYNNPTWGGAIYIMGENSTKIIDSKFINCTATYGGAISAEMPLNITRSQFISNLADYGGAIWIEGNDVYIADSLFKNNMAIDGGAIFFDQYSANNTVFNSTFIENFASNNGGALYIFEANEGLNLINKSIFDGNCAEYFGGAFLYNNTGTGETFNDYEWYNRTAMYDDVIPDFRRPHTWIVGQTEDTNKFENNSAYNINIIAQNIPHGANQTVTIQVMANVSGIIHVNITDSEGNIVNGISGDYSLVDGKISFDLEMLDIGVYHVSAKYDNYTIHNIQKLASNRNSTSFEVFPFDLNVTVVNDTIYVDENVTVIVTLNNLTKGTVNITIGNRTFKELPIVDGNVILNVGDFDEGHYTAVVTFNENEIYYSKSNSTQFNVIKYDSLMNVDVKDNISGSITKLIVTVPENQTGNVTVSFNNQTITKKVTNGTVVFELGDLTSGDWSADVTFEENRIYKQNSTTFNFHVKPIGVEIKISVNTTVYGNNATAIINVSDNANGTINITIDGKNFTTEIVNGTGQLDLNNLTAGVKTGDYQFISSDNETHNTNGTMTFVILKSDTELPIYANGTDIIVNIAKDATGTITVYVSGEGHPIEIINGTVTLKNALTVGDNSVVAIFDGDVNYNFIRNSTSIRIDRYKSYINATATNSVYGGISTVTVEVPKNQTGHVTITVNNVTYESVIDEGKAIFNITGLDVDNYSVSVVYLGNTQYNESTNTTSFEVLKANLTVVVKAMNITVNENATFIIENFMDFKGKVNITVDEFTKSSDITSLIQMNKLTEGEKTAHIVFYDDNNYNIKELDVNFTVTRAIQKVTVMNITVDDVTYPANATAIIRVSDNANGTVVVIVDGRVYEAKPVVNGYAEVDLGVLSAGFKNITAAFSVSETDQYNSNATATDKFLVNKAESRINITTEDKNVIINVTEGSQSDLVIYINGVKQNQTYTGEIIVLENVLSTGNNTVTVIYAGNENYTSSQDDKEVEIAKNNASVNITAPPITYGGDAEITVNVPAQQKGHVTITVNGKEYTSEINNGEAVFNVPGLNATVHVVSVRYSGDDNYLSEVNETNLTVNKADLGAIVIAENVTVNDNTSFEITNMPSDFKGNVTITVDGITYSGSAKSLIRMSKLTYGNKTAHVVFNNDGNYNVQELDVNFTVSRAVTTGTTMNITVDDVTYPANATAIIRVSGNANGTVVVMVDGRVYEAESVVNGYAEVDLGVLSAGVKNIDAMFSVGENDLINNNATANGKFFVDKAKSSINITIEDKNVIINVTEGSQSDLVIYINGVKQNQTYTGEVIVLENVLSIGNNTVLAIYEGNENYTSSQDDKNASIDKLDSLVNVSADNLSYGSDAKITVTVPINQTGYVTITVNNTNYTQELKGGQAVFNIPGLNVGEYAVTVNYLGNDKYGTKSNSTKFNVTEATFEATVIAENVTVLANGTFIITHVPDGFAGKVNITVDGVTYTRDADSIVNIPTLTSGNKTATVVFWGDNNYKQQPLTAYFTVSLIPATINVVIDDVTYPGDAKANVNVSGNANGKLTITIDGKEYYGNVENGHGEVVLTNLSGGVKQAFVQFTSNDSINSNASTTAIFTVNKAQSQIIIAIDGKDVIATTTDGATGNVTFYVNGQKQVIPIENSQAKWENALGIGNNTITVIYGGNVNYTESENATYFIIPKFESFVNVTAENVNYTNDVEITVNVPINQTGFVTITVDGKNQTQEIKNGKTVFTISDLPVKEYEVIVDYLGDSTYNAQSNTTKFNVTKIDLEANVVGNNVTVAQNSEFIITVPGDFKGKVNITVDGVKYSGDVKSLIIMDKLTAGNKTATAVFWGDSNYNDLTLSVKFTVSELPIHIDVVTVNVDNMTRGYNSPYDYQASFLDSQGNALANTEVEFKVNGKTYKVKTNKDGIAQLTESKLGVGEYNITSINTVTGEEATAQLTIVARIIKNKDLTMDFSSGKSFTVQVIGDDGNLAPEGEIIDIYINGIHYVAKVNKNGYAKLKINLNPGKYKISAEYKTYKTTNKLVIKQILKLVKKTVSAKKGKKVVLQAKLKWSNGKPLKGKTIVFKFKGKKYKAKTNSKGVAKVTIKAKVTKKLKKGKKYTFTASYKTNKVKGKIKVKK